MERRQSGGVMNEEARIRAGWATAASIEASTDEDVADTTVLDLLPHPAFAIAVDGDDVFRFIYTNDAYRVLRGEEPGAGLGAPTSDLRQVVPANALVAHVRAFARAARELRTISFETEWEPRPRRGGSRST